MVTEYPQIRGVEPKLLNETGVADLTEYSYPDHDTYVCRGVYEFAEHGITVTIKPHIPTEKLKEWNRDPDFDPASVTGPDGWKIIVSSASNALHNGEGDRVYDTPEEAINAVRNVDDDALTDLAGALDQL